MADSLLSGYINKQQTLNSSHPDARVVKGGIGNTSWWYVVQSVLWCHGIVRYSNAHAHNGIKELNNQVLETYLDFQAWKTNLGATIKIL